MKAKGLQFWIKGWSGSITITQGATVITVTPTDSYSPHQALEDLRAQCQTTLGGTWGIAQTDDFYFVLKSDGTAAWDAAFGGATGSLMGFSASYTGVTTITAGSIAKGGFYPYSGGHGMLYALDEKVPTNQGMQAYGSAFYFNTPADNLRRPAVSFACLRAKSLEFVEAMDYLGSPAKIDLWKENTAITYSLGNVRTSERNAIDGWTQFSLEVVR
tara:strand:- start:363 stop:1007 length:645 start_codon:yes stop_codon:yes gene_type:complete